jgi:hypothetical protein
MNDLNDLFKVVAEGKRHFEETTPLGKKVKEAKVHIKEDLTSLFSQLAALKEELTEEIIEEVIVEEIPAEVVAPIVEKVVEKKPDDVSKYLTGKSFQQPNPEPVNKNIEAIQAKMKFLEQAIGRIAATGPGGGEVNLRFLDDVARDTIADGKWLKYDATRKKFIFDDINPGEIVNNTTLVTGDTYVVQDTDWYVGINHAGPVSITIPSAANNGRVLVIKDESGACETNPITVSGTVDNDAGGFILQLNNGAIQMTYRAGWRII